MTYLPKIEEQNCIVVDNLNSGYIRVYDTTPTANSNIHYTDYFIEQDYITREGTQSFGNYSYSVNCQNHSNCISGGLFSFEIIATLPQIFIIV